VSPPTAPDAPLLAPPAPDAPIVIAMGLLAPVKLTTSFAPAAPPPAQALQLAAPVTPPPPAPAPNIVTTTFPVGLLAKLKLALVAVTIV